MQRKNALAAFGQMVDLDIPKLWQMSCPEEPYVRLGHRSGAGRRQYKGRRR